jgi:hypothetical protein
MEGSGQHAVKLLQDPFGQTEPNRKDGTAELIE